MIKIVETNSLNPDFQKLTLFLDEHFQEDYGEEVEVQFVLYNQLDKNAVVLLIYKNDNPVGCGAFRPTKDFQIIEIKRMFVHADHRKAGIGKLILQELEKRTNPQQYISARLKTGNMNHSAIILYQKMGYEKIPCFEPYTHIPESICLGKKL